jgi:hypothetical protein
MTDAMSAVLGWASFAVSTTLGLVSLGFNLWQHHTYTRKRDMFVSKASSWMHSVWDLAERAAAHKGRLYAVHSVSPGGEVIPGLEDIKNTTDHLGKDMWETLQDMDDRRTAASHPDGALKGEKR